MPTLIRLYARIHTHMRKYIYTKLIHIHRLIDTLIAT